VGKAHDALGLAAACVPANTLNFINHSDHFEVFAINNFDSHTVVDNTCSVTKSRTSPISSSVFLPN